MLLPGLLATAQRNVSVREDRVHIFELGRVFHPSGAVLPDETIHVGFARCRRVGGDSWLRSGVDGRLLPGQRHRGEPVRRGARPALCTIRRRSPSSTRVRVRSVCDIKAGASRLAGRDPSSGRCRPTICADRPWQPSSTSRFFWRLPSSLTTFRDLLAYPVVEQDLALVVDSTRPGGGGGGEPATSGRGTARGRRGVRRLRGRADRARARRALPYV